LMHYIANFLSYPGDVTSINYAVPSRVNADVLRSMGIRFVITDAEQTDGRSAKRHALPIRNGAAVLYLYELPNPNLGTYSPTRLSRFRAGEFFETVRRNPGILEHEAFVAESETRPLNRARGVRMALEARGVRVTASSDGLAAVLLPVQFSYCYQPSSPSGENVRIMRANGLHTLVIFHGELNLRLRWSFSFWQNSGCRLRDVEELKGLGLL